MSLYFNGYVTIKLTDSYAFLFSLNYLVNLLLESSPPFKYRAVEKRLSACAQCFSEP